MSLVVDEGMTPLMGFSAPNRAYPLSTHLRGFAAHLAFRLGRGGHRRGDPVIGTRRRVDGRSLDSMGMMERCMEVTGGMMGGGSMSVMLAVVAFLLFVWILGLVALGGLAVWGIRKLSDGSSGR